MSAVSCIFPHHLLTLSLNLEEIMWKNLWKSYFQFNFYKYSHQMAFSCLTNFRYTNFLAVFCFTSNFQILLWLLFVFETGEQIGKTYMSSLMAFEAISHVVLYESFCAIVWFTDDISNINYQNRVSKLVIYSPGVNSTWRDKMLSWRIVSVHFTQ